MCAAIISDLKFSRTKAHMDRVVPALGYTKANIRWICATCNRRKQDMTEDDIVRLYHYVTTHKSVP